jgi:hypothetical protein
VQANFTLQLGLDGVQASMDAACSRDAIMDATASNFFACGTWLRVKPSNSVCCR